MSYTSGQQNKPIKFNRLDCVKETILAQIKDMAENHPERKVGLVTFTDDIAIIGDGEKNETFIRGQQLNDYNFILKNGVACAET